MLNRIGMNEADPKSEYPELKGTYITNTDVIIMLEYPKYGLKFCSICPKTSNTIVEQQKRFDPPGVTIVSYPDKSEEELEDILTGLKNLQLDFKPAKKLHFTLLSLFDEHRKQNPFYLKATLDCVRRFFDQYCHFMSGPLSIESSLVRPGSWYRDGQEVPMSSNGTVILMADLESASTQKFIRIGNVLEKYLRQDLPYIFDASFKRKFPTMWCTLGYFDHDDFQVTEQIRDTFKSFPTPIMNIKELQIVEFRRKNLEGSSAIGDPIAL